MNQLNSGVYIQYTIDNLLEIQEAKQLVAEGFYQYGVMLFLMDHQIPGPTREKMIVSIYRNKGGDNIDNIDYVRKLCTDTDFRAATRNSPPVRPENYPEDLFERFPIEGEHPITQNSWSKRSLSASKTTTSTDSPLPILPPTTGRLL